MHTACATHIVLAAAVALTFDTPVHAQQRLLRPAESGGIRRIHLTANSGAESVRKALAKSISPPAPWSSNTFVVNESPAAPDDRFARCDVQVHRNGPNRYRLACVNAQGTSLATLHAKDVDALKERLLDFVLVGAVTARSLSGITDVYVPPVELQFASLWMKKNATEVRDYLLMLLRAEPTITVLPDAVVPPDRRDRLAIMEIHEAGSRSTELFGTTYTAIVLKDSDGRAFREFAGGDGVFGSLRMADTHRQGLKKAVAEFLRERRTDAEVAAAR